MKTKAINILRYIALGSGFLASVFFLFFLIGEGIADLIEGKTAVIPILLMMLFAVAGFALAFRKPRIGSLIMVAGGIVMAVYLLLLGGVSEIKMSLIYGLPFILPGLILYFADSKRIRSQPA